MFRSLLALAIMLCVACTPVFVADQPPVQRTQTPPDHFELPARIALARTVYGAPRPAGAAEAALWEDLARRAAAMGEFVPLTGRAPGRDLRGDPLAALMDEAFDKRARYLMLVEMQPQTGTADIALYHVGSAAVMASARAVSPRGGARGTWGWRITNPARLDRVTLPIARAALPEVEALLEGMLERRG